jgi:hypothetical protein
MRSKSNAKYRFDMKSVYLVPLMAFAISTMSIFTVVILTENPKVEKNTKHYHLIQDDKSILAFVNNL